MGRELKRVPMDFDWPMKRVWKGYINPYRGINCPWCYDKDLDSSNGYETTCPHCKGSGTIYINEEIERLNNEWEPVDPPEGDGYQLWETTSEGSPASPVFATLEELCEWCADNATTFGSEKATKEEWMQMLDSNFVCHKEGNLIFI
jgi:hypothetical protein